MTFCSIFLNCLLKHVECNSSCNVLKVPFGLKEALKSIIYFYTIPFCGLVCKICCVICRWRPQGFAKPELMEILKNAAEDSYKRLILPFLCRGYRFVLA